MAHPPHSPDSPSSQGREPAIEPTTELLERVQTIASRLGEATSEEEILTLVLAETAPALSLHNAAIWRLEGADLVLESSTTFESTMLERYGRIPIGSPLPVARAARDGQPGWYGSRKAYAEALPEAEAMTRMAGSPPISLACLPLVVGGRTTGVMALTFQRERTFGDAERRCLMILATLCASALERARLLDAERLAHERTRALFAQAPMGIAIMSGPEHRIDFANDAFLAMGGRGPEIIGRTYAEAFPEVVAAGGAEVLDEVYRTGSPRVVAALPSMVDRGGGPSEAFFQIAVVSLRDRAGQVEGLMGLGVEVTEQVRARRQLELAHADAQVARAEAVAANRLKDEFLATVSHELRTPLNAIAGWAALLAERPSDLELARKGIEIIGRNARAQMKIVEDLLDVSRIVSGTMRIDPRPVDARAAVRDALDAVRPSAAARRLLLELSSPPEPCLVVADPQRLAQIVNNLLSNAVKFTDAGGRITAAVGREGGKVLIVVDDTGRGIDVAFLPHVFEPFRQGDASVTRRHGGVGLGLAIVKELVELHGGRITASSKGPGEGASFRVELPEAAEDKAG